MGRVRGEGGGEGGGRGVTLSSLRCLDRLPCLQHAALSQVLRALPRHTPAAVLHDVAGDGPDGGDGDRGGIRDACFGAEKQGWPQRVCIKATPHNQPQANLAKQVQVEGYLKQPHSFDCV